MKTLKQWLNETKYVVRGQHSGWGGPVYHEVETDHPDKAADSFKKKNAKHKNVKIHHVLPDDAYHAHYLKSTDGQLHGFRRVRNEEGHDEERVLHNVKTHAHPDVKEYHDRSQSEARDTYKKLIHAGAKKIEAHEYLGHASHKVLYGGVLRNPDKK